MEQFAGTRAGRRNDRAHGFPIVAWDSRRTQVPINDFRGFSGMKPQFCAPNSFGIGIAQETRRGNFFHAHSFHGDPMRFRFSFFPFAAAALTGLIGCTSQDDRVTSATEDPDEDRYHEKSFSWDAASGTLPKASALAGIAGKQTTFASQEEMVAAVKALNEKLKDHAFTDSLWKPVDYACDELDLAVWNEYGTVRLGDSVVFDEGILKSRCRLSEGIEDSSEPDSVGLGKRAGWKWWSESEVVDRQYPYKMIGRAWDNFKLLNYESTGGETQFEKRRSRFGITAWYDTDATRIGVRIYLFDCGKVLAQQYCYYTRSTSDWYSNDDYVSKRDFPGDSYPSPVYNRNPAFPISLNPSDALLALHSADHAGIQFRAYSSSGFSPTVISDEVINLQFVTW